ncbi:hypothetical protein ACQR16_01885 [Bradyrhizobium oligotrophicum]
MGKADERSKRLGTDSGTFVGKLSRKFGNPLKDLAECGSLAAARGATG